MNDGLDRKRRKRRIAHTDEIVNQERHTIKSIIRIKSPQAYP
jgi:hypothetical protein